MPKRIITISQPDGWYNLGYLAVLAFPQNRERQRKFIDAAHSYIYKSLATPRMQIPADWRKIRPRDATRMLSWAFRKIGKDRWCAVYYAYTRIRERHRADWKDDFRDTHIPGSRTFATDRFIELLDNEDIEIPEDVKLFSWRMWKESMPVLHLALAIPLGRTNDQLLFDPAWAKTALEEAELIRLGLPFLLPDFDESGSIQIIPA
jgi:hypothetical protein